MGFDDKVLSYGPVFSRGDKGFQIDLVYQRSDKTIVVCEIKNTKNPISRDIIWEVEQRVKALKIRKHTSIEKALITPNGADSSLRNTEYFQYIVTLEDLLSLWHLNPG